MRGAPAHTVEAVADDLRRLGVGDGSLVMVHASLRAIGPVAGGAHGVLAALRTAIGVAGTMLMTLGARESSETEPFDAARTPADPDVGVLAEVFRTAPGTVVSDHPEGRFAAAGPLAVEITVHQPWHDYYGPGSPLERFAAAGGVVLRLGADIETVTLLHYAEYVVDLPHKRRVRRDPWVRTADGAVGRIAVECQDDSDGIAAYDGPDYFGEILTAYLASGRAGTGVVGDARSELLDGTDLVAFGAEWMATHLAR